MSEYGWAYVMKTKAVPYYLRRQIRETCKKLGISVRRMKLVFDEVHQFAPDPLNPFSRKPGHRWELYVIERKNWEALHR